ncbi:MAG: winged helix-turn-helix domain-containing protein [Candidatus Aenigmarchaeota archaeon]|nr:winged helix-turn-helix domain-containing protein [Candidatus Aenigmarchaeota archaeon]
MILEGEPYEKNECLPLPSTGRIILGRSYGEHKADISFKSLFISRIHAVIECRDDGYYIQDLSKHGTWINQKKLVKGKYYKLKDRDTIVLANREAILVCRLNYEPGETLDYTDIYLKDSLIFEKEKRKVKIHQKEFELTGKELKLFEILYENKNKIVSIESIMKYVWPERVKSELYPVTTEEVRQVVYRLRKRLDPHGSTYIRTIRGEGFLLEI